MTDYRYYDISRYEIIKYGSLGYLGIFFITFLFYKSLPVSLTSGLGVLYLVEPYKKYKKEKRNDLILLQFKDMLASLDASFAAGHTMITSLCEARDNLRLIYPLKSPMVAELEYICKGVIENRNSVDILLKDLAHRCDLEDMRNFVAVYLTCRRTGGDVNLIIGNTLHIIIDKMRIEKEIKTLFAQKRFEGKVVSLMPLIVILFLNLFSPGYLQVMYTTIYGRVVMSIALALMIFSAYLTNKFMDIKV